MKLAVTLAILTVTGCATAIDQDTSTTDQAAIVPTGLPSTSTTCQWVVDKTCYGQLNDGNNLWPTGIGITSMFVMTRSGPTRLSGRQQTYLAFVVWNNSVVGRIFRLDVGSSDAANFTAVLGNIVAGRTLNLFDTTAGQGGATVGSPSPPPHPNVEGPITFDSTYLGTVANDAASMNRATLDFLATKSVID
ncbi:MAG TPA: hypothetical protein VF516_35290 [Kofleriaceae bacterium]